MEEYCALLYQRMQAELRQSEQNQICRYTRVQDAFRICNTYWNEIKSKLKGYEFKNDEEEIDFFKVRKPQFTSQIEYHCFLYHSMLFEPEDNVHAADFWKKELGRLQKFEEDNKDFISCYENSICERQPYYFLRRYLEKQLMQAKIYDDPFSITNGDALLAVLFALRSYTAYVLGELSKTC